ncbi:MAG TPA: DUF192 domain-containing protein [Candidatus Baltobacteraceae bacterium]|nr:DUF192 domain-containing protein [Candidatus Baltobacteraceae bacterium]
MYRLYNQTTGVTLTTHLKLARTAWERLVGFLDRKAIAPDDAIWFDRCSSVHTIGMRAPIDVIFLNDAYCVLALQRNVSRNRPHISHPGAASVLEIGASSTDRFRVGDTLTFERAASW